MTREAAVECRNATAARLVQGPRWSDVSNVTVDTYGLHFETTTPEDAPQADEAVFQIDGPGGSIDQRVSIDVLPLSENSPPVCHGDATTERSDGTGPVDVLMHPGCSDPDGDDFVIEGGPPGVHPDSPKQVPAGSNESNWRYRTATFAGRETTTIWATDSLGARSANASLDVTVGPVDSPPWCRPNPSTAAGVIPISSRPGATRRFAIICEDADGDPFASRLSSPPQRGAIPLFSEGAPQYGFWGAQRWIDATYVPADVSLEPDPFSVTSTGPGGDGPAARMAIVPREASYNSGGGCGYDDAHVIAGEPALLSVRCSDNEGDPYHAEIVVEPQHGVAARPVVTPARFGQEDTSIAYVPDRGYEGYDCLKVKISDGHGTVFDVALDIWVRAPEPVVEPGPEPPPVTEPDPPPVTQPEQRPVTEPEQPPLPAPVVEPGQTPLPAPVIEPEQPVLPPPPRDEQQPAPAAGQTQPPDPRASTRPAPPAFQAPVQPAAPPPRGAGGATTRSQPTRAQVEQALGTRAVGRVRGVRGAQVWVRSDVSKRDLVRYGRAPAVVVVCATSCRIRSTARLASRSRGVRTAGSETVTAAAARRAQVLSLTIRPAQRRSLRRALGPRASFRIRVTPAGRRASSVRRSIPIRH